MLLVGIDIGTTNIKGIVFKPDSTIVASVSRPTRTHYHGTEIADYPLRKRGGMGVITMRTSERNGDVASVRQVSDEDDLMLITNQGTIIRIKVDQISIIGRNTQGVKLIGLKGDQRVTGIARVVEKDPV